MFPFKSQFSLEELHEFNDLLTGIVSGEAGLVEGLQAAVEGTHPRLSRTLQKLVRDLELGSSLSESIAHQSDVFPEQYREVVAAGEQGGDILGTILETYGNYIQQLFTLRQRLGRAMMYPLLVMFTAYMLFLFVGRMTVRGYLAFDEASRLQPNQIVQFMDSIYATAWIWGWIPPLILFAAWFSWLRSNDGRSLNLSGGASLMRLVPGVTNILRLHRLANFTEMMSMMISRHVPYGEALRISAAATGDASLIGMSQVPTDHHLQEVVLPPFLAWLIQSGQGQSDVSRPLYHAGQLYRRKAELLTEWLKLLAPLVFLFLVGGGATLMYVLTVFLPFIDLLDQLS